MISGEYPESWGGLNIAILELFPILLAVYISKEDFEDTTVVFFTDNQAVVHILIKQTSQEPMIMVLVRNLVLTYLARNIKFSAQHMPGITNMLPDHISHFQVMGVLLRKYGMKVLPETVPEHILPKNFKLE